MNSVRALLFGMIFGYGLMLSGMTDPDRVRGFLDWTGDWNPALAFVMGGAVLTAAPFFWFARRRGMPIFGHDLEMPESNRIGLRLLIGSAIFGIGWGLSGICPGPGFVVLGLSPWPVLVFLGTMAVGLGLSSFFARRI